MSRVKLIFRPGDYPGDPDEKTREELDTFFKHLFPAGQGDNEPHSGYATLAHAPGLALAISKCADYIVRHMPWSQRRDLREVAVQALNLHFKCDFSFHAHLPLAQTSGISLEQQAAIPYWRTSKLFDDEQRLVIEYTLAVVSGDVPEALFARVAERYGEKGAIECTATIGWWSLWAMLLNATRPEFFTERSQPLPRDAVELTRFAKD